MLRLLLVVVLVLGIPACDCLPGVKQARIASRAVTPPPPPLDDGTDYQRPRSAQAPEWAGPQTASMPQPQDKWKLFAAAPPLSGDELERPLLLLRVALLKGTDSFSPPDLRLLVDQTGEPRLRYDEEDNERSARVAWRVARLRRGDELRLAVWDRDVRRNELVAKTTLRYLGQLPLVFKSAEIDVELRALSAEDVAELLRERIAAFDSVFEQVPERFKVELRWDDLGYSSTQLSRLQTALIEGAAFGGWEHARVSRRSAKFAAAVQAWRDAKHKALEKVTAALPPTTEQVALVGSRLRGRVVRVDCSAKKEGALGCTLHLEVTNAESVPIVCSDKEMSFGKINRLHLVKDDLTLLRLKLRCGTAGEKERTIPPGGQAQLALDLEDLRTGGLPPAKVLRMLRLMHYMDMTLLRLY